MRRPRLLVGGAARCYKKQVLEFRLLGPLEVVRDGAVVTPTGRKARTLLTLFLLNVVAELPDATPRHG